MKKVLFSATVDSHILHFHIPYLKMFKDKGYEVHVATNGDEEIPYCDVKHKISFERSPFKINNLKAIKQLKKVIEEEKFDIIHCHTPMGSVVTRIAAKKARKKFGTRVIYTAHGFHFYKGAPIVNWLMFYPVEKYLSKFTDDLILINNEDYELALKKFRAKKTHYVPGVGIDPEKFNFELSLNEKAKLRKEIGLNENDFVMIYPAELSKRKRQLWLINCISNLLKEYDNIHLLLPGKDSLNSECQKIVKKLNLENQIHFLGYRKDIPKLLKISNLSLSSANQEGLPVNIMEAMYIGIPIIATNCRGNRDLVINGVNGYLVNLEDSNNFCDSILKIYYKSKDVLGFGKKSKELIQDYMLENIYNSFKNIYFKSKEEIAIITSGFLPVPATKGGAAENLLDVLLRQNEKYDRIRPVIFSIYEEEAINISKNYKNATFIFIKISKISEFIDKFNYYVIDKCLKKKNSRKFRYIFQRFEFLYRCSLNLKNNNYDKILLENHSIMYLALKWKKNYEKYAGRYYYHCHNVVPSKYGMDKIIKNTSKVISVSEFRNNYIKKFFDLTDAQCSVVLNCCGDDVLKNVTDEERNDILKRFNLQNKKVVLYIGRVDKDKGTLELVKACNKIKNDNFALVVVGAPIFDTGITTEYELKVKNEIKNKCNYIMTGYVKHDDLYKYYDIADIVVIQSQVHDSAPLVLLESISKGKAVIASNCGGIPEYINSKCAKLINWGNNYIYDLAYAIEEILQNDNMREEMEKESYNHSRKYSESVYYNDFIDTLMSK